MVECALDDCSDQNDDAAHYSAARLVLLQMEELSCLDQLVIEVPEPLLKLVLKPCLTYDRINMSQNFALIFAKGVTYQREHAAWSQGPFCAA